MCWISTLETNGFAGFFALARQVTDVKHFRVN
jgi:hypothetical protein